MSRVSIVFPSDQFLNYKDIAEIVQGIYVPSTLFQKMTYLVSQNILFPILSKATPIWRIYTTPSLLIYNIVSACSPTGAIEGNYSFPGSAANKFYRKIAWLAPVAGMIGITSIVTILYSLTSSFILKGLVLTTHNMPMMFFCYSPPAGLISLREVLRDHLLQDPYLTSNVELSLSINRRSETLASYAFLITNIAITAIYCNPILANCISYPIAAITKVTRMHILLKQDQSETSTNSSFFHI